MKRNWIGYLLAASLLAPAPLMAQAGSQNQAQLKQILSEMNAASAHFRSASASFHADLYTAIVQQHEPQTGTIAFRRERSGTEMMVHITSEGGQPANRQLVFNHGRLDYYEPNLKQETIYSAGNSYESFLTIGFGGSGRDLAAHWHITLEGTETLNGAKVAKLDLVSNDPKVRNNFSHITIWIDPAKSLAYKQELFMPSGDTRTVTYTDVRYNKPLSSSMFTIHAAPGTKKIVK
jgi:outer membrane lipoprotein-sorting protein